MEEGKEVVARYIYQISFGCEDLSCGNPYCGRNISKCLFVGKKIAATATPSLACHLASSRGVNALCAQFKLVDLPENVRDAIDGNNPFIVNVDAAKKSRSATSLPHVVVSTQPFRNWRSQSIAKLVESALSGVEDKLTAGQLHSLLDDYLVKTVLGRSSQLDVSRSLASIRFLSAFFKSTRVPFPLIRSLSHILTSLRNKLSAELRTSKRSEKLRDALSLVDFILSSLITITRPFNIALLHLPLPVELLLGVPQIPRATQLYICNSIASYLDLWPRGSPLSTLPHLKEISEFLLLNSSTPMTSSISIKKIPSGAFFRFYSSLEPHSDNGWRASSVTTTRPNYATAFAGILSASQRLAAFRLACLRQMNSTLFRLRNTQAGLDEPRFILKDDLYALSTFFTPALVHVEVFILNIDREDLLSSSIDCISRALLVENLIRRPIKVRFSGGTDIGIDQGGVQIEFFQALGNHLVFSDYGFFQYENDSRLTWFNPGYTGDAKIYEYIGILFALGLYNGCMIDIGLPSLFYQVLLKASSSLPLTAASLKKIFFSFTSTSFNTLRESGLFPRTAKSFEFLLDTTAPSLKGLDLFFTYSYRLDDGEVCTVRLPSYSKYPNGQVTTQNLFEFVNEYAEYALYDTIQPFLLHFIQGFCFVLGGQMLNLISPSQLQLMMEGSPIVNIDELKEATSYDGFLPNSPTIKYFWSVVREFNDTQKGQLLEFVTGSKRIPVGGVKQLEFVIQRNGSDSSRIPSSSVCFSRLLIPKFESEKQLRKMLLLAIDHSQGFGLI